MAWNAVDLDYRHARLLLLTLLNEPNVLIDMHSYTMPTRDLVLCPIAGFVLEYLGEAPETAPEPNPVDTSCQPVPGQAP